MHRISTFSRYPDILKTQTYCLPDIFVFPCNPFRKKYMYNIFIFKQLDSAHLAGHAFIIPNTGIRLVISSTVPYLSTYLTEYKKTEIQFLPCCGKFQCFQHCFLFPDFQLGMCKPPPPPPFWFRESKIKLFIKFVMTKKSQHRLIPQIEHRTPN